MEQIYKVLETICFTVSILSHQRISDAEGNTLRKNMEYLYSEADKLGILFLLQNAATKAGYDNDLRVVYLRDAMAPVRALMDKPDACTRSMDGPAPGKAGGEQ